MRRRPLLLCACVFVLGLLYEKLSGWYIPILIGIIAIYASQPFLTAHHVRKGLWRCLWIGGAFVLGILHMQSQTAFRSAELAQICEGEMISLCGEIYKKEIKNDQLLVYLKNCYAVSNTEQLACNRVLLYQTSDDFSIGDILLVNGKVNMFQSATNEGAFDSKSYYFSQKLDFAMKQASTVLLEQASSPVPEAMWQLRKRVAEIYADAADVITAGVLSVMILGEKSMLDSEVKDLYQSMGISHILAISGLHVSLVGLGIYRFLRRRGMRYSYAFVLSGVLLFLYAIMTGSSVSTRRAVGMLFLLMLADMWGRAYDSLNALGAMILYLLWENPFLLEYAGFTLSVAAVLGVATVGAAIQIGEREEKLDMTRVEMEDDGEPEELRGETECACQSKKNRAFERVFQAEKSEDYERTFQTEKSRDFERTLQAEKSGDYERTFQTERNGDLGITLCATKQRGKKCIRTASDKQGKRGTAEGKKGNMHKLMNTVYMGVGIWLFTLPLIAFYYYEIPLYSALLNLFVVPLLKYLILLGVAGAVVGVAGSAGVAFAIGVAGSAGVASVMRVFAADGYAVGVTEAGMPDILQKIVSLILLPCQWILSWYDTAATACLNLPFAQIIVGKPSVRRMILYYAAIAVFAMIWSKQKGRHWIRLIGIAAIFAVLLIPSEKTFEVDVLDVGQGDGTYICTEEGISMFIDGGSSNVNSVGTYQILPFLKSKGIQKISYWFVSHADADHISGLLEVIESGYQIDNLIIANRNVQDDSRDSLLELALANNINVICMKTGDIFISGQTQIICLSPDADNLYEDRNDGGLVLLYKDEQFSGMFAGDIPSEVEDTIVAQMDLLNVDFYKANHHGSKYSSSERWLAALTPEVTSISCSSTNTYGHPHEETLERLSEVGTEIYRTDELGAIKITLEDGGISVSGYRSQ